MHLTSAQAKHPVSSSQPLDETSLLHLQSLTKDYGEFALRDLNLSVEPGMVVGLVGTNGAGKSTALRCALGLATPTSGSASVLGVEARKLDTQAGKRTREGIGVVFDTTPYPPDLRVRGVERLMGHLYDTWNKPRFEELAKRFGLTEAKHVKELSRGMGMELQLACALSHGARLLVLDEATAGLDPLARSEVLDMLRTFMAQDGHGILMATHITSDVESLADVVVCLDGGRVAFSQPKDDICDRMGVARMTTAQLEGLVRGGTLSPGTRMLRRTGRADVLVDDRRAFARQHPDVVCERIGLDEYMELMLKGATL